MVLTKPKVSDKSKTEVEGVNVGWTNQCAKAQPLGYRKIVHLVGLGFIMCFAYLASISIINQSGQIHLLLENAANGNLSYSSISPAQHSQAPNFPSIFRQPPITAPQQQNTTEWCQPLHFKAEPGPVVALASFPGSGNTWFRYLLQQASGIMTGSVFKNLNLLRNGFPGENIANGSVSVIKLHKTTIQRMEAFDKLILLVRDPLPAILAEFNRQAGGQVGYAPPWAFKENNGERWGRFVYKRGVSWEEMNLAWFSHFSPQNRLIVFYVDLKTQTEIQLRRVLTFLNIPVRDAMISCALARRQGLYHRPKRILHFEVFNSSMRQTLADHKRRVYSILGKPATFEKKPLNRT
ncbi:WSCD family member CG9164-like [Tigriopus californicus]|uniref:WSCD family member CG9164-like n=1 Tax=Tigriopus californicus TaxID=6832 RepID=UPI0027DA8372|nr:WSCD family member CG9164-like [Tigriopus californicus]